MTTTFTVPPGFEGWEKEKDSGSTSYMWTWGDRVDVYAASAELYVTSGGTWNLVIHPEIPRPGAANRGTVMAWKSPGRYASTDPTKLLAIFITWRLTGELPE